MKLILFTISAIAAISIEFFFCCIVFLHRVGILAGGSLIFEGTLDELREITQMQDASLENIFIRLVQQDEEYD